jgi:hypothetical protein
MLANMIGKSEMPYENRVGIVRRCEEFSYSSGMIEEATPGNMLIQSSLGVRPDDESRFVNGAGEQHHGERRQGPHPSRQDHPCNTLPGRTDYEPRRAAQFPAWPLCDPCLV